MLHARIVYQLKAGTSGAKAFQTGLEIAFREYYADTRCDIIRVQDFNVNEDPEKDIVQTARLAELEMCRPCVPDLCIYIAPRSFEIRTGRALSMIVAVQDSTELLGVFMDFPRQRRIPRDTKQQVAVVEKSAARILFRDEDRPPMHTVLRRPLHLAISRAYDVVHFMDDRRPRKMTEH